MLFCQFRTSLILNGGSYGRNQLANSRSNVGWVERQRNPPPRVDLMGFAPLNPSYALQTLDPRPVITCRARPDVGALPAARSRVDIDGHSARRHAARARHIAERRAEGRPLFCAVSAVFRCILAVTLD